MFLSNKQYIVTQFEAKHVDATAKLIIKSFVKLNPIWKAFNPDPEELFAIVRLKILPCSQFPTSTILLNNNQIIGAQMNIDLCEYKNQLQIEKENPVFNDIKLFKFLNEVQFQLEKPLMDLNPSYGECHYAYYGAMDPDFKNQGISFWFWHQAFAMGRNFGVKKLYTRTTNVLSFQILKKLGGKEISNVVVENKEIGIEKFTINLVEVDMYDDLKIINSML